MSSGDRRNLNIIRIAASLVVFLHLWATTSPGAENWGVHLFAFLPAGVRISGILLMIAILLPSVQDLVAGAYDRLLQTWSGQSLHARLGVSIILVGAGAVCFWIAREGTTFLGDGFGFIRSLPNVTSAVDIPSVFRHEPLAGYLLWRTYGALVGVPGAETALLAFRALSIAFGIGFLIVLALLIRTLTAVPADRPLLYAFVLFSGGTQLFFGYVETYPPAYAGYVLFLATGLLYLRGNGSLFVPSILFAVLFVFYFGMLAFAPVMAYLFFESVRRREPGTAIGAFIAGAATAGALLALCGYTPDTFLARFWGAESHIVPLFQMQSAWQGYTMFSVRHLLELVNVCLLLSPFTLILFAPILAFNRASLLWKNVEWRFIFLNSCCGLLMLAIFQCDIGMSRDWDLLAVFAAGSIIATGYLVLHAVDDPAVKQRIMLIVVFISMIHFAAFVAINSHETRAIPRFMTLVDNSLWGKKAFTVFEELAIYYREKNDLPSSAEYYRKFLEHDSTNSRVLGNYADALRGLGDEEGERAATERAISHGARTPGLYFNLGVMYGKEGRYDEAIAVMIKGLEIDPHRPDILNSIGVFLMQGEKAYDDALPYFGRAMAEDSSYALAYLNTGLCNYHLGNNVEAAKFLAKFLRMDPRYPRKDQIEEILNQISTPD